VHSLVSLYSVTGLAPWFIEGRHRQRQREVGSNRQRYGEVGGGGTAQAPIRRGGRQREGTGSDRERWEA